MPLQASLHWPFSLWRASSWTLTTPPSRTPSRRRSTWRTLAHTTSFWSTLPARTSTPFSPQVWPLSQFWSAGFLWKKIIDLPGGQLFGKLLFSFVLPANLLSPILEGLFEKTWRPLRVINFTSCIAFKTYKMLGTQSVASRLRQGSEDIAENNWHRHNGAFVENTLFTTFLDCKKHTE